MPAQSLKTQSSAAVRQLESTAPDAETIKTYLDILRRLSAPDILVSAAADVSQRILEASEAIKAGRYEEAETHQRLE